MRGSSLRPLNMPAVTRSRPLGTSPLECCPVRRHVFSAASHACRVASIPRRDNPPHLRLTALVPVPRTIPFFVHGELALQCGALHCDKEKTQKKEQPGIKPLSASPCLPPRLVPAGNGRVTGAVWIWPPAAGWESEAGASANRLVLFSLRRKGHRFPFQRGKVMFFFFAERKKRKNSKFPLTKKEKHSILFQ